MRARYASLFWRLFIPNATVLAVACVVLIVEPANGHAVTLIGGLLVMVAVNLVLITQAVRPLARLTALMQRVDPLIPSERIPVPRQQSEVTVLAEAYNAMLDRLELERRDSGQRALNEREHERRRIADELHDQIGQTMTAIALQLDRIHARAPDNLRADCRDARDGLLTGVDDVRRLARDLRPEALDTLGLVPALTDLAEQMSRRTGIPVDRALQRDLPAFGENEQLVVYRVAQEALTNAVRHAHAQRIELVLRADDEIIVLTVVDDGVGLGRSHTSAGGGIRTMHERALSIGADLQVTSRQPHGTMCRLEIAGDRANGRHP
ncbi:MAG: sensor histidine kinase [Actinomycetota bacterium]|nr:sensor histidine kinase [Actinomycetota bacterium]